MPDLDKPVIVIVTIHPAKKHLRPITVSAAPEGEMPLLLTGQFADRHALADQAYAALLKRKPKLVSQAQKAQFKKSHSTAKSQTPPKGEAFDGEPDEDPITEAANETLAQDQGETKPDQLVRPDDAAGLPVIEGDAAEDEDPSGETEFDALEDPDDRNAPSAQPDPAEDAETQESLF